MGKGLRQASFQQDHKEVSVAGGEWARSKPEDGIERQWGGLGWGLFL